MLYLCSTVHRSYLFLHLIHGFNCWLGIYKCRDLQKATHNFTALIGQGAFGPVYKAQMSTGEIVAVKVLATDSKQGEKEFHTEVLILTFIVLGDVRSSDKVATLN